MMWFLLLCGLMACTGEPVGASCPIVMTPPVIVVPYGGNFSVDCTSLHTNLESMGWESSTGRHFALNATVARLLITSLVDWTFSPQCYINPRDIDQCSNQLPVTLYKTMDSVSLSQLSEPGPMVAGEKYRMRCDVTNVAPASNLTVSWYKGNKIIYTETFTESSSRPVNKSSIKDVTVHQDDNGSQVWCEAKLMLAQTGLNLPTMASVPRDLNVFYPPSFTNPKDEAVEVAPQSQLILNCTATGNPQPVYSWQHPPPSQQANENLPILNLSFPIPGTYSCRADNHLGTQTKNFAVSIAAGNRTTLAAIIAVFTLLGIAGLVAGIFFVTPNGTFSLNRGSYHPTSSRPV